MEKCTSSEVGVDEGGWLELLLSEAPEADFAAHEHRLAQQRGSTERAAGEAVAALRIRALLEQRTQRARELATLNEVAADLTATGRRDQLGLIDDIVVHARRVLGVDMAYLGLEEASRRLRIHAVSGALTPHMVGMSMAAEAGLAGEVLSHTRPAWTDNYETAPFNHHPDNDAAARAEHARSVLGVPLLGRDRVLGVLFVLERRPRRFTGEDIALLVALAAHAAVALDNQQLVQRYQDGLAQLNQVNCELERRTGELEQALRWDNMLTQVVLRGGQVADLLAEVRTLAGRPVHLVTADGPPPEGIPADRLAAVHATLADLSTSSPSRSATGSTAPVASEPGLYPVVAGRRVLGALVTEPATTLAHTEPALGPALDAESLGSEVATGSEASGDISGAQPWRPGSVGAGSATAADGSRFLDDQYIDRLLARAAPALALTLTRAEAVDEAARRARDSFLSDLLNNPGADPAVLDRQMRFAGLDPSTRYDVLVATAGTTTTGDGLAALRAAAPKNAVVADLGSRTVIVLPQDAVAAVTDSWSTRFGSVTAGLAGPVAAGARGTHTDGADGPGQAGARLGRTYREAGQIVDALLALGRVGELCTAEDLGIYRVLLSTAGRAGLRTAIERNLGPLLSAEQRRGVPLSATLLAYLEHNLRPGAAAEALAVHVNTLYQRLEAVTAALGDDWRQPARRLDLHLMLRLRAALRALPD
ncbi:GAF domain-containing protein [Pseudonocardia sp. CA-142604]|uniref:helix-turn-helix domain-containing protein n=1 Tax=Pseudonocardia sp. CA-142604 TaxID=3240024 RepID=UPI003D8E9AB8